MYTNWYRTFLQALIKFTKYNSCCHLSFPYKFLYQLLFSFISLGTFTIRGKYVQAEVKIFSILVTPSLLYVLQRQK